MRLFLRGSRRVFEVLSYDAETHHAKLRNEKGEEFDDPNFWPEIIKRVFQLEQRNAVES